MHWLPVIVFQTKVLLTFLQDLKALIDIPFAHFIRKSEPSLNRTEELRELGKA